MASGVNLAMSRRTRNIKCKYWKRDESIRDLTKYEFEKKPAGLFYAKPENSRYSQKNIVGDTFMFDSSTVTISTSDVINIEEDDIVSYKNKIWRVASVQVHEINKRNQLCLNSPDCITYMQLKR